MVRRHFVVATCFSVGSAVTSRLVRSSPDRAVLVRELAGDSVLCSWARYFTLTVPLSTQVYKWVPTNLMLGGNPAMDKHPIQGGVEILLVASCYRNRDELRPGSYTDFTFFYLIQRQNITEFSVKVFSLSMLT